MKNIGPQNKEILIQLFGEFQHFFQKDLEESLFETAERDFFYYIQSLGTELEQECLQAFVKKYYMIKKAIVSSMNDAVDSLSSKQYLFAINTEPAAR